MAEQKTDALVKPDMKAVLSRTHLGMDLHSFLLPVLESISNSMHSIETKFGDDASKYGKLKSLLKTLMTQRKSLYQLQTTV